jgi:hypothetical protein
LTVVEPIEQVKHMISEEMALFVVGIGFKVGMVGEDVKGEDLDEVEDVKNDNDDDVKNNNEKMLR